VDVRVGRGLRRRESKNIILLYMFKVKRKRHIAADILNRKEREED
jgi:hypothetical protein